ncbi:MAG: hypothetical protein JWN27_3316 [Candidatus Eremiobacteraeota bacterium]|nr:hypothetical protein [Candidatus Eremiobacteraeota bacterium]
MPHRRALFASALVVALVVFIVAAHEAVAAFAVRAALFTMGYRLEARRVYVTPSSIELLEPVVDTVAGEPLFTAARVDVGFSLRDLLPGSRHRFGLTAVDLERPVLTLIHQADGSYNVALPGPSAAARPDATPIDLRLRVRNGTVALVDRFVEKNRERRESLVAIRVDAVLQPRDPAYYRVDAMLHDGARRYPISGRGRIDHGRLFASQHWHAAELPIGPLVDFAMATYDINLVDGRLRDVDARIGGFLHEDGSTTTHLGIEAQLIDGKMFVAKLGAAVGDAHGPLRVYDDGLTTTGVDATLAHAPLHLVGGIYSLAHPQVRFVLTGSGRLAQLRALAPQTAHLPLDGALAFDLRADGDLGHPVVRGMLRAPRVAYGGYALSDVAGEIAFGGSELQVVGATARYGAIGLRARGAVTLADHVESEFVAAVDGPANGIPYAAAVLPGVPVRGIVVLRGTDARLAAHGAVDAAGAAGTLDAPFALEADGTGTIGPVALERSDGATLYARVGVDRPRGTVDAIVSAHRLTLFPSRLARLPGVTAAALPAVSGCLDADLTAEIRGASLAAATGALQLRRAGIAGIPIGDAVAHLAENGGGIALTGVNVHGPLGTLRGEGAYDGRTMAARGRFNGSLERLAQLHAVRARGSVDAQLRFVADGRRTVVQIADARFTGARVQGIALTGAQGTFALRPGAIDVDGARLDAAGGTIVAHGSFGNGGVLRLSASGVDAGALRAAGVPLSGGRVVALAALSGTLAAPRADAGVALGGARIGGAPLDGSVSGAYARGRVRIDDARGTYAGAVARAKGSIDGVHGGVNRARVDVAATVRGADVATLAHQFRLPLRFPEGSIDADMRVAGAASDPSVAGDARIAAGSLNGLGFRDLRVPLQGGRGGISVRGGRATVGSTTLAFDAAAGPGRARVGLRADHADLADFDNYFDAADTLAGRGRLAATVALGAGTFATNGDVALHDARLRRFPLGDVTARWTSHDRTIAGAGQVGGPHGTLSARGTATIPSGAPLAHLAASNVDVRADLAGLDLAAWLPAAGIAAPVTGRLNGFARVRGRAPNLAFAGKAALRNGVAGRIPIKTLTLAAAYDRGRGRVTNARLDTGNALASGAGTFGLAPNAPIDLAVSASTPDAGAFVRSATGTNLDAAGALAAQVHLTGTRRVPSIGAVADLDRPRYGRTSARRLHADVALAGGRLIARSITLDLAAGRLALTGSVPVSNAPPFIDRNTAPIAARMIASAVDLGQFDALLPPGTKVGGIVNGDLAVAGTVRAPRLDGTLALAKGSYVSPVLASQVRNATVDVALAGRRATIRTLHADIGGGAIDGGGVASVGDLRDPVRSLAMRIDTREKNVGLDLPRYFRGKMDGTLSLRRDPGTSLVIGGDLAFSHARVPLNALLPTAPAKNRTGVPLPVAFDLTVAATTDDRVQSANVDVGARGSVHVSGTLAQPALAGNFSSTDGTISLYRTFILQRAEVAFDPGLGFIPDVDVTATTQVPDPSTEVLLHAHGPATGLALDLSSRPAYDKAQIIGLLVNAQALGAVRGVAATPGLAGGSNPLQGVAVGYIDQQFTRGLFEPFSSGVGKSLGFSTFTFNAGLTGGFSAGASRALGDKLAFSFAESTDPLAGTRQSIALAYDASASSAVQLTLFDAGTGARTVGVQAPAAPIGPTNFALQALAPPAGSSGYVFTLDRRFP